MRKSVLFFAFMMMTALIYSQTVAELMQSAERLKSANNEALAIKKYERVLEINADYYEALYNISLICSHLGNRESEPDSRTQYFTRAKEYAERAIIQNPTDAEGHFVLATALEMIAGNTSSKEKVTAINDMKMQVEEAIKYNNKHSGAWHMLGRWNIRVANMSSGEKMTANLLFGGVPKGASNENAIKSYTIALTYDPENIQYFFDRAQAYEIIGQNDKAKEDLEAVLKLKTQTQDDPDMQEKARLMLSKL